MDNFERAFRRASNTLRARRVKRSSGNWATDVIIFLSFFTMAIMITMAAYLMMLILSGSYLPFASGVAGGDIARLISSKEGPWDHQHEYEEGGQDPDEEDMKMKIIPEDSGALKMCRCARCCRGSSCHWPGCPGKHIAVRAGIIGTYLKSNRRCIVTIGQLISVPWKHKSAKISFYDLQRDRCLTFFTCHILSCSEQMTPLINTLHAFNHIW